MQSITLPRGHIGVRSGLFYCRTKEGREIDFAIELDREITHLIECKWADDVPHPNFEFLAKFFPRAKKMQLVRNLKLERTTKTGIEMRPAVPWLAKMPL